MLVRYGLDMNDAKFHPRPSSLPGMDIGVDPTQEHEMVRSCAGVENLEDSINPCLMAQRGTIQFVALKMP
jgi:hypothetical protein